MGRNLRSLCVLWSLWKYVQLRNNIYSVLDNYKLLSLALGAHNSILFAHMHVLTGTLLCDDSGW